MKKSIVCYTSKPLTNGENPIMIRLYHEKYKYIATGVSCKVSYWNPNLCRVSSKDAKYKEKNEQIEQKYEIICQRIKDCFQVYGIYDLELIADTNKTIEIQNDITPSKVLNFLEVIDLKIKNIKKYSYQKNFIQLKNALLAIYGNTIYIKELNQGWFNGMMEFLSVKTIRQQKKLIKHFLICYNWGWQNGYITNYQSLKYNPKDLAYVVKKRALIITQLSYIKMLRQNQYELYLLGVDMQRYRVHDYTYKSSDLLNALTIYMIMYALQGVAPVDLASLRIEDLKLEEMNSNDLNLYDIVNDNKQFRQQIKENTIIKYYSIADNRNKTGSEINIKVKYDILHPLIKDYMYKRDGTLKDKTDYLLNVYEKERIYTDKQRESRRSNYFSDLNKQIKDYLKENGQDFFERFSYYTARHTYLTIGYRLGIKANVMAQLAAHNEAELQTYFAGFDDITILEANDRIFNAH